jgi:hypothetical protein
VFLGNGLLFLAMLFAAAAVIGRDCAGRFCFHAAGTDEFSHLPLARAAAYIIANVYAIKMAAVFMISTSTVVIRTGIAPRWIAFLGFLLAMILLIGSFFMSWSIAVLPFLGLPDQRLHPDRQSRRRLGGRWRLTYPARALMLEAEDSSPRRADRRMRAFAHSRESWRLLA